MTALHAKQAGQKQSYIFASESVSEGHPDKVCDQISDAILDAYLDVDPASRVACECLATLDRVILSGELRSSQSIEVEPIVQKVIRDIGYTDAKLGFDDKCQIQNYLHKQSAELSINKGAGDQGLMFGYACNQTKSLMPVPIEVAQQLLINLAIARKSGSVPCLLPDAKSQVSFRFEGRKPRAVESLVISTHHQNLCELSFADFKELITQKVVYPTLTQMGAELSFDDRDLKILINPLGEWHEGGPGSDTGLTGRKIIVDTYGGWAQHGGGAFSGKDPTKVDRSAAYMARHIAKSVVGSGLADECLIQFSFVIGQEEPESVMVETFGSGKVPDTQIEEIIRKEFDLTVLGIIEYLGLDRPIYLPTAAYGHFGLNMKDASWEQIKKL
ncbi:MAG: methionine adenosyltransferase [Candidatus Cloacimonetes bacterium]|jgi:S-adenosylmethionine synthetase|nr:methionine adenosyltransferase [Candidatus Cloacimonadota bacterium]MCB5287953.1 methionine adenosyltransferase [Candidatus Cloacimonadota bacterium]MCK9184547.1 methionine adenosyltransferase [Candidatus Cloacimonadota bacterium]MCK9584747.1 methionine adenosyltransferase [Candidatus Cloacimonadota bacterium]MDY0230274.1 methionine adenosyltransferase [Candidatus Cloacimonadaceae bacterium]